MGSTPRSKLSEEKGLWFGHNFLHADSERVEVFHEWAEYISMGADCSWGKRFSIKEENNLLKSG